MLTRCTIFEVYYRQTLEDWSIILMRNSVTRDDKQEILLCNRILYFLSSSFIISFNFLLFYTY